jgi:hypothetical protein
MLTKIEEETLETIQEYLPRIAFALEKIAESTIKKGEENADKPDNDGHKENCKQSRNGGGQRTELEVALAKKCLHLSEKLGEVNKQRKEFFEGLYSALLRIEKAGGADLKAKRLADLTANAKASEKQTEKLNEELKGIIGNGESENRQGSGAGEA